MRFSTVTATAGLAAAMLAAGNPALADDFTRNGRGQLEIYIQKDQFDLLDRPVQENKSR